MFVSGTRLIRKWHPTFVFQVVGKETSLMPKENFGDLLKETSGTEFRGRREKILFLKDKLRGLQNRIKELEDEDGDKPRVDAVAISRIREQRDLRKFQNKKVRGRGKGLVLKSVHYILFELNFLLNTR